MKLVIRNFLFIFMVFFSLNQCSPKPEYQTIAEKFIETYYIQINPKGAVDYAHGPALEKLQLELQRLAGMAPPLPSERPKMSYKILSCKSDTPDSAECHYELKVQTDKMRTVHGQLTLGNRDGKWWVTEFKD